MNENLATNLREKNAQSNLQLSMHNIGVFSVISVHGILDLVYHIIYIYVMECYCA